MKVAIVGGGICGLFLAEKLSKKKETVFVFEKKRKVGQKPCSGLFSERIFEFYPEAKNLVENQINYCLIHFPKKTIKVEFKRKFFVIERRKIDELAFQKAKRAGAQIFLGHRLTSIPEGFDRVIGCDGANSLIRKILGQKKLNFYFGFLGYLKKKDFSDFVETWPTKEGFLWKIPRGEKIEYGIIEKPKWARKIFEEFLTRNEIKLESFQFSPIAQGIEIPENEKITLCGEAAGLTKPWSGGGVIWGLKCCQILLETFPDFLQYHKRAKKFFSFQFQISKFLKNLVFRLGFNFPYLLPSKIKIDGDFWFFHSFKG